ncbi:hypothetical protein [Pseudomonas sp. GOM6]|uniref:hypothetical protein n=1 Tax=Pseudomonas sp. GOM6 TaxID=3036944 RepID=UPI002409C316|nr:hypothetical protein [Pseudomonas sp. GOM6]MDG1581059.1 hypothetical protein [Pseudomonas sp. GOM6]
MRFRKTPYALALALFSGCALATPTLQLSIQYPSDAGGMTSQKYLLSPAQPLLISTEEFKTDHSGLALSCHVQEDGQKPACNQPIVLEGAVRLGLTAVVTVTEGPQGQLLVQFDGHHTQYVEATAEVPAPMILDTQFTAFRPAKLGEKFSITNPKRPAEFRTVLQFDAAPPVQ